MLHNTAACCFLLTLDLPCCPPPLHTHIHIPTCLSQTRGPLCCQMFPLPYPVCLPPPPAPPTHPHTCTCCSDPLKPFRMPIVDKYRDMGTMIMGKSEQGLVQIGDVLQVGVEFGALGGGGCHFLGGREIVEREQGAGADRGCITVVCIDKHVVKQGRQQSLRQAHVCFLGGMRHRKWWGGGHWWGGRCGRPPPSPMLVLTVPHPPSLCARSNPHPPPFSQHTPTHPLPVVPPPPAPYR